MADDATGRLTDSGGIGGIGYAHAMQPPPPSDRQPRDRDSAINTRWTTRWQAWAAMRSKSTADPADTLELLRLMHRARCVDALNAGLPWTTLIRSEIDSPMNGAVWFNAMLRLSIERRRCRMNRRAGYGKKYDKPRKKKENT